MEVLKSLSIIYSRSYVENNPIYYNIPSFIEGQG